MYFVSYDIICTLKLAWNGHHIADDILKWIFLKENFVVWIHISLKCVTPPRDHHHHHIKWDYGAVCVPFNAVPIDNKKYLCELIHRIAYLQPGHWQLYTLSREECHKIAHPRLHQSGSPASQLRAYLMGTAPWCWRLWIFRYVLVLHIICLQLWVLPFHAF